MKFRADRDTLLDTLVTAARATSARAGLNFGVVGLRLLLRGDQLEVCGSDPDLVIEARCQVAGDTDGSVLVPSRLVVDIVRSFEPGAVAVAAGDEEVRFSSGRAEFVVRVAIGAEITRLGVPEQEGIEIPGGVFADGLRQVVRAALVDDSRAPQLTGVLMVATETGLRLIATDSYRLAFRDFAGMTVVEAGRSGARPREGAGGGAAPRRGREGGWRSGRSCFATATSTLSSISTTSGSRRGCSEASSPRSSGSFRRLTPTTCGFRATTSRPRCAGCGWSSGTPRTPRRRCAWRCTTAASSSRCSRPRAAAPKRASKGISRARISRSRSIRTTCSDGVEAVRAETLVLEVNDPGKPALVRGEGEDEYRYLLMPVKVS